MTRKHTSPLIRSLAAGFWVFTVASANAQLTGTFNAPSDIPVTAKGYTAAGRMNLTLNCALPTGADLTVVDNTSRNPITGQFTNLPQDKPVKLSFGGLTYQFIVDYYGGTGNDLVLRWAKTRTLVWGYNYWGNFGNVSEANSSTPVVFFPGLDVAFSATGGGHSLALLKDGRLTASGYGAYGQLGVPSLFYQYYVTTPVSVRVTGASALFEKKVISLAAGNIHSLALCSDGTMASWGYGDRGELGTNRFERTDVPTEVFADGALSGKQAIAIAAGQSHNLALLSNGSLVAWGVNDNGQLGIGSNANTPAPAPVIQNGALFGKNIVAIAAGINHSLALAADGTVAAWGDNASGQLGNNSTADSLVPVKVDASGVLAGRKVVAIAAGNESSLALCADGSVVSWGNDAEGQLGDNPVRKNQQVPVLVDATPDNGSALNGKTVVAIAKGRDMSLALCADGTVATWGDNGSGNLGEGTTVDSAVPIEAIIPSVLSSGERVVGIRCGGASNHPTATVAIAPLPGAVTLAATSITATSATLNGEVTASPSGATKVNFVYGLTNKYGTFARSKPSLVTGTDTKSVSAQITGLLPGKTYHFRVRAKSPSGETKGRDVVFTTPAK